MKGAKNQETKYLILKAAIDEFAEKGRGSARTGAIAKRAGVASGLVHYYFGSKDNLYKEVLKSFCDTTMVDDLSIFPYYKPLNPLEKLTLIIYGTIKWFFMLDAYCISKFFHRIMIESREAVFTALEDYVFTEDIYLINLIEEGNRQGLMDVDEPTFLAFQIADRAMTQISRHNFLKDTKYESIFYKEGFEKRLTNFYMKGILKQVLPQGKSLDMAELPADLKNMMDSILELYYKKVKFGTCNVVIKIASKIFGENIRQEAI